MYEEKDYFAHLDELPNDVREILDDFFEMDYDYQTCHELNEALGDIGWVCDYGIDAEPHSLRPMTEEVELEIVLNETPLVKQPKALL